MGEWFADGSGGFRDAFPLITFGIGCPPSKPQRVMMKVTDDLGEPRPTRENGRPGPPRTAFAMLET
jgi:hypothetical protein